MSIEHWRKQIDAIDDALVRLINERARCARMIGYLKSKQNLPIVDTSREEAIYRHITRINAGPLDPMALRGIYERIIDEMRLLQGNEDSSAATGTHQQPDS